MSISTKDFVWEMTENQWTNLVSDYKQRFANLLQFSPDFDYYGCCKIGHLCADIQLTGDPDDWYAFVNIFGLGIDVGYGETACNKIPYALMNEGASVPIRSKSFEAFKRNFEQNFLNAINDSKLLTKLASQPLGDWR